MQTSTAASQPTLSLSRSSNLLPPNSNPILQASALALYNTPLILISTALLLHTSVFGTIFLLRGFSASRALDTQFLTIVFALSFPVAALIFLLDFQIDALKLLFFLEHEAIECVIALRVFLPKHVLVDHGGAVLMGCWTGLCLLSILVVSNPRGTGADVVSWGAFVSDGLLSAAGAALVFKFYTERKVLEMYREEVEREDTIQFWGWKRKEAEEAERKENARRKRMWERKIIAEALAGIGFIIHGISTLPIAPIWTRIMYYGLDPRYFAYAWVAVFGCAFISVALCVPSAALFFSTINWCCGHDRKMLPGQVAYIAVDSSSEASSDIGKPTERSGPTKLTGDVTPDEKSSLTDGQKTRFSNWFSFSAPPRRASPKAESPTKADPMEQWEKLQQQYIETQARTLAHVRGGFSRSNSREGSINVSAKTHSQPGITPLWAHSRSNSNTNSSMTATELNRSKHGRTGTQESGTTIFLPPAASPPKQATGNSMPMSLHNIPVPPPQFVFPQVGHHRRGSSLARLAAMKREQQQPLSAPSSQQYLSQQYRRPYGSEGSLQMPDGKGKARKRSISESAGEASFHQMYPAHQWMIHPPVPPGNNMFYWTGMAPTNAGGEVFEVEGGKF